MVTLIIIAITSLVSILCFTGTLNGNRLLLNVYSVWHLKEWHRMLTHGLVHGGWGHLIYNMLTLYFFGRVVEQLDRISVMYSVLGVIIRLFAKILASAGTSSSSL